MTTLDWDALLKERNAWVAHNFPNSPWHESVFGVNEEFGELNHAHLKAAQHIRGSELEHAEAGMDAIGDLTVYLLGIMNFAKHTAEAWTPVILQADPDSADRALFALGRAVGALNWRADQYLYAEANDRPTKYAVQSLQRLIDRIVYFAERYCYFQAWDYNRIVLETWGRVKLRDWVADPIAGGERAQLEESSMPWGPGTMRPEPS